MTIVLRLAQVTELWRDIGFVDSAKADYSKKS